MLFASDLYEDNALFCLGEDSMGVSKILWPVVFLLLSQPAFVSAANHYIRQGAAGAANGVDWANAWTDMPTSWVRGDKYYVAGGGYAGRNYNTPTSGTLTITIKGAIEQDHGTDAGWSSSYSVAVSPAHFASSVFGYNTTAYWVFDGSVGSASSTYGFVMDAPSSGNHYAFVLGGNVSATVSNIRISHVYARARQADVERFFVYSHSQMAAWTDSTVSYCLLDGFQGSILTSSPSTPATGIIFEYNYVLNGYSSPAHHGEDINANGAGFAGLIVRHNVFDSRSSGTAVVCANNGNIVNSDVYGNLFIDCVAGNGMVAGTSQGYLSGVRVYNNTFVRCSSAGWFVGGTGSPSGNIAYNNLLFDMNAGIGAGIATCDYNAYFQSTNIPAEAHGQTGSIDPFADSDSDYHIALPTSAGFGLPAPYNVDIDGVIRGADGAWDRGAYEYPPLVGTPKLSPPSGLRLSQ